MEYFRKAISRDCNEIPLLMTTAIVTGGAGFIGSHVVEQLIKHDCFVHIIDNMSTGQDENLRRFEKDRFELIHDDVRNIGSYPRLSGAGVVYHLAAEVGNINSIERTYDDASTNILGTIRVCEWARTNGAKIVYSSSSAIFGESAYLPIDEAHPTRPASPYGLSKLTGELYVRLYGQLHDVPNICLRYFNVYGEGQLFNPYSNVIPIFIRRLLAGEPLVVFGDGEQTRDFVHVSDVARANLLAGESEVATGVFNVGTGTRTSLLQLLDILKSNHGSLKYECMPSRGGEVRDSVADIRRIQKELNFAPQMLLAEGVKIFYEWQQSVVNRG